ncbi:MAG: VCBS repeat-containing protein [Verrucomicrobia bacterium]|nr:VCBS repeat-containing protein [Verrucomicrobiota bacterium]
MRVRFSLAPALCAALTCWATSPALRAENAISNPGFEQLTSPQDNLWDGVNSDGFLAVSRRSLQVLTERASLGTLAIPPCVQYVDLNGDGKPDLLVADPTGFFWAYFNSGTRQDPKFTRAELIPIYLSRVERDDEYYRSRSPAPDRRAPRVAAADWGKTGKIDFLVGNFLGELFFLPNQGTAQAPVYRNPDPTSRALLPTTKDGRLWANLLSPAAVDWNRDGRLDVLLGEGSYSANVIRLLENTSSSGTPQFPEDRKFFLAYGDGREHLIPTVADLNGDGRPDILASDRTGQVGVYLNTSPNWKPGDEIPFTSYLSFGGSTKPGGQIYPCAADWNGDGLIDVILGRDNGRISVCLNKGTAQEPKFDAPFDVPGTDLFGKDTRPPAGWEMDDARQDGNAFAFVGVVTKEEDPKAEPPEGNACLKFAYTIPPSQIFQVPNGGIPGAFRRIEIHRLVTVTAGTKYELTFKAKGSGLVDAGYNYGWRVDSGKAPLKIERGERGSVTKVEGAKEDFYETNKFSAGEKWSTVTKSINTRLQKPGMENVKQFNMRLIVQAVLRQDGVLYLDDFQLVEKK